MEKSIRLRILGYLCSYDLGETFEGVDGIGGYHCENQLQGNCIPFCILGRESGGMDIDI